MHGVLVVHYPIVWETNREKSSSFFFPFEQHHSLEFEWKANTVHQLFPSFTKLLDLQGGVAYLQMMARDKCQALFSSSKTAHILATSQFGNVGSEHYVQTRGYDKAISNRSSFEDVEVRLQQRCNTQNAIRAPVRHHEACVLGAHNSRHFKHQCCIAMSCVKRSL